MQNDRESKKLLTHNKNYIPGGVVSVNRATQSEIAFAKGEGSRSGASMPTITLTTMLLSAPIFSATMTRCDRSRDKDFAGRGWPFWVWHNGARGTACGDDLQARSGLESVQLLNTGSEAKYQAICLGRAVTARDHVIKMQGATTDVITTLHVTS